MSLKIKPRDVPRKTLTPAQEIASTRAFRLFRLRGLYSLAHILSPNRRAIVHAVIDHEIEALGGEPQGVRERRELAELVSRWPPKGDPDRTYEIPF